jgi:hypothetical protein
MVYCFQFGLLCSIGYIVGPFVTFFPIWHICILCSIRYIFFHFGMLYRGKSGNRAEEAMYVAARLLDQNCEKNTGNVLP